MGKQPLVVTCDVAADAVCVCATCVALLIAFRRGQHDDTLILELVAADDFFFFFSFVFTFVTQYRRRHVRSMPSAELIP